jgi:hypothetical protein
MTIVLRQLLAKRRNTAERRQQTADTGAASPSTVPTWVVRESSMSGMGKDDRLDLGCAWLEEEQMRMVPTYG